MRMAHRALTALFVVSLLLGAATGAVAAQEGGDVIDEAGNETAENSTDTSVGPDVNIEFSFLSEVLGEDEVDRTTETYKLQVGPNVQLERIVWYENDTAELHIHAEEDTEAGILDLVSMQDEGRWEVQPYQLDEGDNVIQMHVQPDPGILGWLVNPHQGYRLSVQEGGTNFGETVEAPDQPLIESVNIVTVGIGGIAGGINVALIAVVYVWGRRRYYSTHFKEIGGERISVKDEVLGVAKAAADEASSGGLRGRVLDKLADYSHVWVGLFGLYIVLLITGVVSLPTIPDPVLVIILVSLLVDLSVVPLFLSWVKRNIPEGDNYFWSVKPDAEGSRPVRAWKTGDKLAQRAWDNIDGNVEKDVNGTATHTTGYDFDPREATMEGIWRGMPDGGQPWDLMRSKQRVNDIYGWMSDAIDLLFDRVARADTETLKRDKRAEYRLQQFDAEHESWQGEERTDEFRDEELEDLLDISLDEVSDDANFPDEVNDVRRAKLMADDDDGDDPGDGGEQ